MKQSILLGRARWPFDLHKVFCSLMSLAFLALPSIAQQVLGGEGTRIPQDLAPHDLTVLQQPAGEMMKQYLTALVDEQFARRDAVLAKLHTAEDWNRHSEFIRKSMAEWTGPFPPRAPLNAQVTGMIERSDYTVEKVLFESRPGFLVSANLYLPKGSGRRAAVLNLIGHSPAGKATETNQRLCIALARKGFVAFAIDAIGQGERQVPDYVSFGKPPGNTHQIIGAQAFLAGTHVFNIMAWDAIRAIDYLARRPEVDPERIACTGSSGGGMMTTYLLPFEPRIAVAVPVCNPNTWSHRVHAGLTTDHEQVFAGAFAAGIDPRGDPLFCQAPKPLLINATSDDDLNPPAGVWELNTWLDKAYAAHREPQRFKTSMVRAPHEYNREQREVSYAWMLKWLEGDASQFREDEFSVEDESATWCTPHGSVYAKGVYAKGVYAEGQSRQPHDLVLEYLRSHRSSWPAITNHQQQIEHNRRLRGLLTSVLGLPDQIPVPEVTTRAAKISGDLRLTPIEMRPEKGIVLPGLWVESAQDSTKGPVVLYLHDQGKAHLAEESIVKQLVLSKGFRILAIDLRGQGETAPGLEGKFWDFLLGKPIFAQRVSDVRSILRWLSKAEVRANGVYIWAQGVTAACASIGAVMDDIMEDTENETVNKRVLGFVLEEAPLSFESIVTVRVPTYGNEILVSGILENFDLPQIYQAACPKRTTLINPLRGDGSLASDHEAAKIFQSVSEVYRALGTPTDWQVFTPTDRQARSERLLSGFADSSKPR